MKQKNIFVKSLLKSASWVLAHASWITMTLSPVAMGKEAEKKSTEFYKQQIHELGLDRKMTAKEFWAKVKNTLPGYAYYEIEQIVNKNPEAIMPEFQVKSVKTSDGSVVPVISFNDGGKTQTVQIYGEKDKFLKFNNTIISENESTQPEVLFQKLMDNDSKLEQRYQDAMKASALKNKASAKTNSKQKSFYSLDKKLWKKMTAEQRVSYIIYMRQLYLDAQKVLSTVDSAKAPAKKTSSVNVFELLFKELVPSASAEDAEFWAIVGGKRVKVTTNKNAKECVVAGYVSQEAKTADGRVVCAVEVALKKDRYQPKANSPLPFVSDANQACQTQGTSFVACNPIVYSYDSNGQPYCIDRNAAAFKTATHWDQGTNTCDGKSKLTDVKEDVLQNTAAYKDLTQEQIEKTGNLAKTKEFIKNYLKSSGKEDFAACIQSSKLTAKCEGLIAEVTTIGENFKKDINAAIDICNAGVGKADSKQAGACDQIRKRWLSYEALIAGLTCEDGTKPVEGKCSIQPAVVTSGDQKPSCPEGSTSAVNPEWCDCKDSSGQPKSFKLVDHPKELPDFCAQKTVCEPGEDTPCPEPVDTGACSQYPPLKVGVELNEDCQCVNKKGKVTGYPKEDQPGFLAKLFNTKKNKAFKNTETTERKHSCKFGPSVGEIVGLALGVAGVATIIGLAVGLAKKPKTVTETKTDVIDNTVTCKPPKFAVLVSNNADSSTQGGLLGLKRSHYECVCPSCGRYYLQNGTSIEIVPNPLTCACTPPPTEGGGTTPTGDGNSGGVPTQN